MDFFEKLTENCQSVANKAMDAVEIGKYNALITREEGRKKSQYTLIGKKYVEIFGKCPATELEEFLRNIEEADNKIEEFKKQIALIKGTKVCPMCQAAVDAGSVYCGKCGYDLTKDQTTASSETDFDEEVDGADLIAAEEEKQTK